VQLEATLRLTNPPMEGTSRVNSPMDWRHFRLLIERVGIAPTVWIRDDQGYTLARANVVAKEEEGQVQTTELPGGYSRHGTAGGD